MIVVAIVAISAMFLVFSMKYQPRIIEHTTIIVDDARVSLPDRNPERWLRKSQR